MKRGAPKRSRAVLPELGRALTAAVDALDTLALPYALVGGLAVGAWGVARATRDVDLYTALTGAEDALQTALEARGFHVPALREELERFGVFRSRSAEGVFVDIFSAVGSLGAAVLEHRVRRVVRGRRLWFVAAEELVLLKAFSDRPRDFEDLVNLVGIVGAKLDTAAVRAGARELDRSIGGSDVSERLEDALSRRR